MALSVAEKNRIDLSPLIAPFQPQTEEGLFERIDHSLSQIESGEYSDAEDVENEFLM